MRNHCRLTVALACIFTLLLLSCNLGLDWLYANPAAEKTCVEGVCVELTVAQPIVLNRPTNVIITIRSTVNKPGLLIKLGASPTNVTFGPDTLWQYDAVANQGRILYSTVIFKSPGGYLISAGVYWKGSPLVSNQDYVVIDNNGAVVNPTINPHPTSDLFIPSTPLPESLTATAQAEPTFTPLPPVEGFSPQEWLQKCGWTVDHPETLTEWTGLSGWLGIKESVVKNGQLDGDLGIGFKDIDHPETTVQARIGLCPKGQGWTTDGDHEWNVEMESGVPFVVPVSLRFTQTGEIPVLIVILDTQRNRITGIGRLIYVKAAE